MAFNWVRKFLGASDPAVDEATGTHRVHDDTLLALLNTLITGGMLKVSVAGGSAVINVDMAQVDVDALITGIANGKTLLDVWTRLSADPATQTTLAAILAKFVAHGLVVQGDAAGTALPVSHSGLTAAGAVADAPVAYNGAEEDATARTSISLLKRIANALKAACASLGTIAGFTCNTGAVTVSASALPSGAATSALQAGLAVANNPGAKVSVTNVSTLLLAANPNRRSACITNRSLTAMLTISLGGPAVSGAGDPLAPAADATHPGGSRGILPGEYSGAVYGIMSAADVTEGNVSVTEV